MAWIHINCGVSCHNGNSNSTAYGSGMLLRLDPTLLDGRSSVGFDTRTTTLGLLANNPMWTGQTRIVPGDPSHSLLVKLITNRGTDNPVAEPDAPDSDFAGRHGRFADGHRVDREDARRADGRPPGQRSTRAADAGSSDAGDAGPDATADAAPGADASADALVEDAADQ